MYTATCSYRESPLCSTQGTSVARSNSGLNFSPGLFLAESPVWEVTIIFSMACAQRVAICHLGSRAAERGLLILRQPLAARCTMGTQYQVSTLLLSCLAMVFLMSIHSFIQQTSAVSLQFSCQATFKKQKTKSSALRNTDLAISSSLIFLF